MNRNDAPFVDAGIGSGLVDEGGIHFSVHLCARIADRSAVERYDRFAHEVSAIIEEQNGIGRADKGVVRRQDHRGDVQIGRRGAVDLDKSLGLFTRRNRASVAKHGASHGICIYCCQFCVQTCRAAIFGNLFQTGGGLGAQIIEIESAVMQAKPEWGQRGAAGFGCVDDGQSKFCHGSLPNRNKPQHSRLVRPS